MGSSVHVQEALVITPSETTPFRFLPLSALDSQLFLRFTIEYLFIYKTQPGLNRDEASSRIKTALSKALVPYYPLAGRVRVKSDGLNLEVVCRGQGAVFIEAVSDHTAAEFEKAPRLVTQWRKFLSLYVADVLKGAPPLVVQMTWLNDGALAVGVGLNHCICDGIGSAEFLNLFAELASGQLGGLSELKPKPVWDRQLMDPIPIRTRKNSVIHHEFNRVNDVSGFSTRFSNERLSPTSIIFSKRYISQLKKMAMSTSRLSELNSVYTSFEVLSAHVWRSWARALNLPSNQILKLLFSINVRDRVRPTLPSGYYGNAFVLGCAKTSVKDLVEKGLGYGAMLIREAKERVDDEYVRTVIDSVSEKRSPDSVGVLILSQWSRLGLERVDFGVGRLVSVGPVCTDRYCLFLPVFSEMGAVKVTVAIPVSGVDTYERLVKSQ